jgi:exosome complex component CSL4
VVEGEFVVPGDEIGVVEEYLPSAGAYVHDGFVRAKAVGFVKADASKHEAAVVQARDVPLPRLGDVVYAVVTGVRDAVVYLDIFYNETRKVSYAVPFRGILHISEASNERLRSTYEVFGYGDIVRANVISRKPPYMLSTKGPEFGLVLVRCPRCMTPLRRRGLWLYCPVCRKTHKRKKIASRHYLLK